MNPAVYYKAVASGMMMPGSTINFVDTIGTGVTVPAFLEAANMTMAMLEMSTIAQASTTAGKVIPYASNTVQYMKLTYDTFEVAKAMWEGKPVDDKLICNTLADISFLLGGNAIVGGGPAGWVVGGSLIVMGTALTIYGADRQGQTDMYYSSVSAFNNAAYGLATQYEAQNNLSNYVATSITDMMDSAQKGMAYDILGQRNFNDYAGNYLLRMTDEPTKALVLDTWSQNQFNDAAGRNLRDAFESARLGLAFDSLAQNQFNEYAGNTIAKMFEAGQVGMAYDALGQINFNAYANKTISNLLYQSPQWNNSNVNQASQWQFQSLNNNDVEQGKQDGYYIVQKGNTLGDIAAKFNTTISDLQKANVDIVNPNKIYEGQSIIVPTDSVSWSGFFGQGTGRYKCKAALG